VVEAGDFQDTTPAGRALQAMIAGNSHEQAAQTKKLRIQELEAQIKLSNIPGYFPTPKGLAEMMVEIADIEPGMRILEPSAGSGAIADTILESNASLDVIEVNPRLRELLTLKGYNVTGSDCLADMHGIYDRILMNPPFEAGCDMLHVRACYGHLAADGVLVAILSPHFEFASDRKSQDFRQWLEEVGASWDEIPAGAFKESGTMVASRIMVIDKRN
jgi:16S rRNA G1207 methylase RsmC